MLEKRGFLTMRGFGGDSPPARKVSPPPASWEPDAVALHVRI
jgi:hypothetical protein